jgi:hypothetical protein
VNRLYLILVLWVFFPALLCKAEMPALNDTPNPYAPIYILKTQGSKTVQNLEFVPRPGKPVRRAIRQVEVEYRDTADKDPVILSIGNRPAHRDCDAFLSEFSPVYRTNKNFLSLSKTPFDRDKKDVSFVFFMNRNKVDPHGSKVLDSEDRRTKVHVLWPGSKRMNMEQTLIKDEYPVDVSIANYEDGYSPGEWNVVLPSKKPNEVKVSWAWSF